MKRLAAALLFLSAGALAHVSSDICSGLFGPHLVHVAGWEVAEETSAEAELPLEELLPWIETDDGTLRPILEMPVPPPAWLARDYAGVGRIASWMPWKRRHDVLSSVPWGALPAKDRMRLVVDMHHAMGNLTSVQRADRAHLLESIWPDRIPGLRLRPRTDDAAAIFLADYVGYVFERTDPSWGEAHLRGPFTAGQARAAMFRLFPSSPSVHVHCPVPLAVVDLISEGFEGAALRTDLMLRANAFAEMLSALYRGSSLHAAPRRGRITGSAPLTDNGFAEMARYFLQLSHGDSATLEFPWLTKNAFVGLRENELYDRSGARPTATSEPRSPFLFVGLEHRFLRRGKAGLFGEFPETVLPVVDAFMEASRQQLRTSNYGNLRPKVRRWTTAFREHRRTVIDTHFPLHAKEAWYRTPEAFHGHNVAAHLSNVVDPQLLEKLRHEFIFAKHEGVAMLTFDWGRIPLLVFDPVLATQVAAAQRDACKRVRSGQNFHAIVRRFIWQSGLLHALAASFGLPLTDLPLPGSFETQ